MPEFWNLITGTFFACTHLFRAELAHLSIRWVGLHNLDCDEDVCTLNEVQDLFDVHYGRHRSWYADDLGPAGRWNHVETKGTNEPRSLWTIADERALELAFNC